MTFRQLDDRSNQIAHALRGAGCKPGDTIALFAENSPRYFEICWGAQRAGIIYTAISTHLGPDDASYILDNCEARVLFTSHRLAELHGGGQHVVVNDAAAVAEAARVVTAILGSGSVDDGA